MRRINEKTLDRNFRQIASPWWSTSMTLVSPDSPFALRMGVEMYARYFRKEFGYDFVQFDAKEEGPYVAYLLSDSNDEYWVGATCFRWREFRDAEPGWAMQWVWVHPFARNRGCLSLHWKSLEQLFGKSFHVEPPLSPAMEKFLRRRRGDSSHVGAE